MRNYGINLETYDEMQRKQGGRCRICKTDEPSGKGRFHVDHCHATKRIRGLLCATCNMMLGMAEDCTDRLKSAIEYLEDSRRIT